MAESGTTTGGGILQFGEVLDAGANADGTSAWLHFTYDAASNATIVEVKAQAEAGALAEAKIVLAGVNLTALGSDSSIISQLLANWNSSADV